MQDDMRALAEYVVYPILDPTLHRMQWPSKNVVYAILRISHANRKQMHTCVLCTKWFVKQMGSRRQGHYKGQLWDPMFL